MEMRIIVCLIGLLFPALLTNGSVAAMASGQRRGGKSVMCTFEGISAVRPQEEARFTPEDIDVSICTHVVYSRALVNAEMEVVPRNREVDLRQDGGKGMYDRALALKDLKPGLKVLIDVYDYYGELNKQVASGNRSALAAFVQNSADFVQRHGFDGMDVRARYPEVLHDVAAMIHEEFVRRGLTLITMVLPDKPGEAKFEISEPLSRNFDLIVVSSYWQVPNDQTVIFSSLAVLERVVEGYTALGIPADKLVVAIPAFVVSLKLCDREQSGVGIPVCGGGHEGMYESQTKIILHSSELMRKMANTSEDWVVRRDSEARVNYGHSKSLQWASFEDPESVRAKAGFILERGLRGAAIMNVDMEDFKGAYTEGAETFPLARAAFNALNGEGS